MEQIHQFIKGISTDIDYSKRDSLTWDFPSVGIRIFNQENKGLVITFMPGNCNDIGDDYPTIQTPDDYFCVGACNYGEVVYLMLFNPETKQVEFGSFPGKNPHTNKFENQYHPFNNILDGESILDENGWGERLPFTTDKIPFEINNQVDMFAAPNYDGSVNVFIADGIHPNLCINSGFNQEGKYNLITYNDNSFPYGIRLIKSTDRYPIIEDVQLSENGTLPPANYYLFFRYVTASFDRTAFLSEIGPISVYNGNSAINIDGIEDLATNISNKAIDVKLINLDVDYKYIEVGVIRWHGPGVSNAINDIYLIDKYYPISPLGQMHILINGQEDSAVLTMTEIMDYNSIPAISKTHTIAGNRYMGAQYKDAGYDVNAIKEYASKIFLSLHAEEELVDLISDDYERGTTAIPQYKDAFNILNRRSHFRGEIYPYAIIAKLSTGGLTEAFPIQSMDFISWSSSVYDGKGLIRFPDYVNGNINSGYNDIRKPIGIAVNSNSAVAYYNDNTARFDNIVGFYLVRGERKPNMLYQGLSIKAYNKANAFFLGNNDIILPSTQQIEDEESVFIPSIDAKILVHSKDSEDHHYAGIYSLGTTKNKYALFSADYGLSSKNINQKTLYIKRISRIDLSDFNSFVTGHINPLGGTELHRLEVNQSNANELIYLGDYVGSCSISNTNDDTFLNNGKFSTLLNDKNNIASQYGFFITDSAGTQSIWNRTVSFMRYIGLDVPNTDLSNTFISVCLYESNSIYWSSIWNSFEARNETYQIVSDLNTISGLKNLRILYTGDCFPQRTFLRAIHWKSKALEAAWYNHGLMLSFNSENAVNTQMRSTIQTDLYKYSYFPNCLSNSEYNSLVDFTYENESNEARQEARYINSGYNVLNGTRLFNGYNPYIPFRSRSYLNRVYISAKQVDGSFQNSYRVFPINSYVDYPWENGPINCIRELYGKIITITDNAIYQHYYNESQYRVPTNQGELLLGQTDILSKEANQLSSYGTKHSHGVLKTDQGIYGIDTDKYVLFMIASDGGQIRAIDLSKERSIQSELRKVIKELKSESSIKDIPVFGSGITIGYNPTYKEVYITLLNSGIGYTFLFSEEIGAFTGYAPFEPNVYVNTNKAIYSTIYPRYIAKWGMYAHDNESVYNVFYGARRDMVLSIIANGLSSDGNTSDLNKIFTSGEIVSDKEPFSSIEVRTINQVSLLNPFLDSDRFWKTAVWDNDTWKFPMPRQEEVSADYNIDSAMTGRWIKIKLVYSGIKNKFIQSIKTKFNPI